MGFRSVEEMRARHLVEIVAVKGECDVVDVDFRSVEVVRGAI